MIPARAEAVKNIKNATEHNCRESKVGLREESKVGP